MWALLWPVPIKTCYSREQFLFHPYIVQALKSEKRAYKVLTKGYLKLPGLFNHAWETTAFAGSSFCVAAACQAPEESCQTKLCTNVWRKKTLTGCFSFFFKLGLSTFGVMSFSTQRIDWFIFVYIHIDIVYILPVSILISSPSTWT